jgi:hypothetical protein
VRVLDPDGFTSTDFASNLSFPVDLDVGPDGALYYLNRGESITGGHIGRISSTVVGGPVITGQPQNQSVAPGGTATFSVQATGDNLSYQWQRNGANINGANAASLTIENVQAGSNTGQYRVIVSNGAGSVTSNSASLSIVSGSAPTAIIDAPSSTTRFRGGQTIRFSGRGLDDEDGELGADRFTWQVDYHTGSVVRPFFPATSGITEGTFTIPNETVFKASNVFYRVRLTVTDADGSSTTTTRDIQPIVSTITLRSNVAGAKVFIDGQTKDTPTSFNGVAGIRRLLSADATQVIDGVRYVFDGWSDGGDRTHTVSTPLDDVTYVARWRQQATGTSVKGVTQTIYNNRDRTGTVVTRTVPNIGFNWSGGKPHPSINGDTFFIRFRAKVQPEFTETYTFFTRADDGVRLFVNGQLLVDQWADSDGTELSGTIDLEAGHKYDLRFDYFENIGFAQAQLLWESPSTPKQLIPKSKFFSTLPPQTLVPTADAYVQGGSASGTNFGDRTTLIAKSAGEDRFQRDAYLKFDITDLNIPTGGAVKLRLNGRLSDTSQTNVTLGLFDAPRAKWGESSITWDNRPATAARAIGSAVVTNEQNQVWEFDITNFLRNQKDAGRTIVTFVLRNLESSSVYTILQSRTSGVGPQLVVSA